MAGPHEIKPGEGARPITKGTPFNACRSLYIGTAGTLNFTPIDGVACVNFPAQAGMLTIATASVEADGTADDIWAVY